MGKGRVCLYRQLYMRGYLDIMIMIRKRAIGVKKMTKREKKGITIRGKEPEYGNAITMAQKSFGRVPIKEVSKMVYGYAQMALGVLL